MEEKIKIRCQQDQRVFTLFCALNLTEHNKIKESILKVSPQYHQIQKHLKKNHNKFISKFTTFFKKDHYIQYLIWVLRHSEFPDFELKAKNEDSIQHSDIWFAGFDKIIKEFYLEAKIDNLWDDIQANNNQAIKWYKEKTQKSVLQIMDIFKNEKLFFQEVCIVPNLLETLGAGCGVLVSSTAYIVFGSTYNESKDTDLIAHELLHNIINPIIDNDPILKKQFKVFKDIYLKITTPDSRKYYSKWEWVGYEYLVKIVHAQIMPVNKREKYFNLENKWGFPKVEEYFSIYQNCKKISKSYQEILLNTLREIRRVSL